MGGLPAIFCIVSIFQKTRDIAAPLDLKPHLGQMLELTLKCQRRLHADARRGDFSGLSTNLTIKPTSNEYPLTLPFELIL